MLRAVVVLSPIYLMSSHMPTRVTARSPDNTWGSSSGSTSTW
jgi:hypothetical protein